MSNLKHVVCPSCNATNRIPEEKLIQSPLCGKCHKALFQQRAFKLNAANFQQHINRNDIPVVVDFWAPWCGPCKMMAPAFEEAAGQLEPNARLMKLNTEEEQAIGGQWNIRSIPTMVIFKNGQEIARQSGAMQTSDIVKWVKANS